MKFKYTARNKDGELQAGYVESFSKEGAINILAGHELFILSIESAETTHWYDFISRIIKRVTSKDLMIFTRQFSILLESKVPLLDSIKNLQQQTGNQMLQEVIYEITSDIESGLSLSQALEKQGKIFSEFYVSIIKSAEITGHLEEALIYLADYLEKERMWRQKIQNALIYPAFLLFGFFAVVVLMVTVVFPKIKPVFEDSTIQLPWFTKFVLGMGDFLINWWWIILAIFIPIFFLILDYFKTDEGKIVFDEFLMRIPVLGMLFKKMYIARFAESLNVLITGGIPIAQALEISGHSIGSFVFRDILHITSEKVRGGQLLSASLKENETYFFPLVSQMIAIGESTGRLEEILSRISKLYTRDVDDLIGRFSELIQPILIIFIGIFIGVLFASILIPIYNLIQNFKS
ncbi:MAG: type II secretion system F family protein [Patescibacteria group bacterium]|nr:type II secretion system F family protein [Patescibacteria group bacterium]